MTCPFYGYCVANQTTAECKCDIACIEIYAPVCGTDGKTYSNDCHMRRQACIDQKNITVSYKGECSKSHDLQLNIIFASKKTQCHTPVNNISQFVILLWPVIFILNKLLFCLDHQCPVFKCKPCPSGNYLRDKKGCQTCQCGGKNLLLP